MPFAPVIQLAYSVLESVVCWRSVASVLSFARSAVLAKLASRVR